MSNLVTVHLLICLHHILIVNISTVHRLTCLHHLQWSDWPCYSSIFLTCLHHMLIVNISTVHRLTCLHHLQWSNLVTVHLLSCLHHMLIVNISTGHRLTCLHHLRRSDLPTASHWNDQSWQSLNHQCVCARARLGKLCGSVSPFGVSHLMALPDDDWRCWILAHQDSLCSAVLTRLAQNTADTWIAIFSWCFDWPASAHFRFRCKLVGTCSPRVESEWTHGDGGGTGEGGGGGGGGRGGKVVLWKQALIHAVKLGNHAVKTLATMHSNSATMRSKSATIQSNSATMQSNSAT